MKKNICVVPGCTSTDTLNESLKYHQIPKDAELRKKWLKAINRTEPEINKKSKVCSKHFKSQDYAVTRFNYTMGGKNTASGSKNTCEFKALKNEAVPNQQLPQKSTFKIKISKKDSVKQIKVEEVKVKEEKIEKPEKLKMPKRSAIEMSPPRSRTQSRRAASKEALKQMQLLLDDENDTVEIPDDDVIPIDTSPLPPPKKKYKLSHRKSSDGNDRDVIVLKTITNRDAENTLELDCWVEELEEVQKGLVEKYKNNEIELQAKLDSLINECSGKVIHKGDLNTIIEVSEQVQSAIQDSQAPPTSLILNNNLGGQQSYQLVMDPRVGLVVGAISPTPSSNQQKVYQGKVQVAQNLQQTPVSSPNPTPTRTIARTRTRTGNNKTTPPAIIPPARTTVAPSRNQTTSQTRAHTTTQTRAQVAAPQTRAQATPPAKAQAAPPTRAQAALPTRAQVTPPTRAQATPPTRAQATPPTRSQATLPTRTQTTPPTRAQATTPQTRGQAAAPQTRGQATTPQTRRQATTPQTSGQATTAPQTRGQAVTQTRSVLGKKQVTTVAAPNTRGRGLPANTITTTVRPDETNVQGGLATGGKKVVVDLTTDDNNKSAPDSREIAFNKLQGKTYPSLVVVARPHLRVQDLAVDRPKLDAKVKSVLMHAPTKFTEWLIQQGLIRSEQKCSVHTNTQLKLGMYSDVSKFPYSGGYVWISECCPQRFVSVFSGSLFEGSPHPPMVILKLLYHWSCQTNIQNVTQWVKVDNLYVKGMFTWLRSICTVALHTHIRQIGGPGVKVEVGVISLGTTSQDGNQRQVKVEVLGVLESESKLIRLRAVEPQAEGDRNYKKRFSKILEPVCRWVHPQSILVADLTVDKQTLIQMGFQNVVQYSSNQYGNNNQIMEYLRRIVPRMFQNTLSLLSRQIIQQFLDELVWREWFGTSALQAFDNVVMHLSEQTRFDSGQSLIVRLNKVAQNPFKSWAINTTNPTKVVENTTTTNANTTNKKQRNARKLEPPKIPTKSPHTFLSSLKVPQPPAQDARPPKSTSPDVPEHMVPLESYYYGTIDTYSKTPKITLNMKCPFCKSMFDNNIQLMSHLFKHAHNVSMDAQLCRYCLTSVATVNDLLKHIATSHPAETKFDNGFCCLICETQYMNPFVLGKHMSKEHYPSELPYQCGTCSYRCSNHKQAIDHFYITHDNGPTIQCPFCLKSTTVFTASRNIVQNMNYFIQHLQKHQRKQFARRCGKCNLWFVQKDVLKDHQNKMHVSQRGKNGLVPWTAPRNGIMVPKSKMDKYPVDAEVINFAILKFDFSKGLICKECNTPMDTPKHFPSFESCQNPNCQYSTCCTNAMQEHNAKCSKTSNPVSEEKLLFEMFCICGFSNKDGNQMARHLAICERKSAYPSRAGAKGATVTHSMLDVLGLVRKAEEKPKTKSKKMKKDVTIDKAILDNPKTKTTEDIEMIEEGKKVKKTTQDVTVIEESEKVSKKDNMMEIDTDTKIEEKTDSEMKEKTDNTEVEQKTQDSIDEIKDKSEDKETNLEEKESSIEEKESSIEEKESTLEEKESEATEEESLVNYIEDNDKDAVTETAIQKDVTESLQENKGHANEESERISTTDEDKGDSSLNIEKENDDTLDDKQTEDEEPSKEKELSQSEEINEAEEKLSESEDVEDMQEDSLQSETQEEPSQTDNLVEMKDALEDSEEAGKEITESEDLEDTREEPPQSENLVDVSQEPIQTKDFEDVREESSHSEDLREEPSQSEDLDDMLEEPSQSEDLEDVLEEPSQSEDLDDALEEPSQSEDLENEREEPSQSAEDFEDMLEEPSQSEDLDDVLEEPSQSEDLEDALEEPSQSEDLEDALEEPSQSEDLEDALEKPSQSEDLEDALEKPSQSEDLEDEREEPSQSEDLEDEREEPSQSEDLEDEREASQSEDLEDDREPCQSEDLEDEQEEPSQSEDIRKETTQSKDVEDLLKQIHEETPQSEDLIKIQEEPSDSEDLENKEELEVETEKIENEEFEQSEKEPESELASFEKDTEDREKDVEHSGNKESPEDLEKEIEDSEKVAEPELALDKPDSNHLPIIENTMETSEIPQEKEPAITSDDIQNLLSDVVGENDETSVMETDGEGKQPDDVNMASPMEMMDVGGEAPTPMETD